MGCSWFALGAACAFGLSANPALAEVPSPFSFLNPEKVTPKVEFEGGMSPTTQAFLNGLPADVRLQVERTINTFFDRMDQSLLLYTDVLGSMGERALEDIQCTFDGTLKTTIDRVNPFDGGREPIKNLRAEIERLEGEVVSGARPSVGIDNHLDAAWDASRVGCQWKPFTVETSRIIEEQEGAYRVWRRVDDLNCATIGECGPVYKREIGEELQAADPRDRKAAGDLAALNAVQLPKGTFWNPVAPEQFEATFAALFAIESALDASRSARASTMRDHLNGATEKIASANHDLDRTAEGSRKNLVSAHQKHIFCNEVVRGRSPRVMEAVRGDLARAGTDLQEAAKASLDMPELQAAVAASLVAAQARWTPKTACPTRDSIP